jgi:hypothetical protein
MRYSPALSTRPPPNRTPNPHQSIGPGASRLGFDRLTRRDLEKSLLETIRCNSEAVQPMTPVSKALQNLLVVAHHDHHTLNTSRDPWGAMQHCIPTTVTVWHITANPLRMVGGKRYRFSRCLWMAMKLTASSALDRDRYIAGRQLSQLNITQKIDL